MRGEDVDSVWGVEERVFEVRDECGLDWGSGGGGREGYIQDEDVRGAGARVVCYVEC